MDDSLDDHSFYYSYCTETKYGKEKYEEEMGRNE
jgi:hypothetical protein